MDGKQYMTPAIEELEVISEGVLCGSNEHIDENEGIWWTPSLNL